MGFSRQECWSGLLFPSPRDLPNPGIEPALYADSLLSESPGECLAECLYLSSSHKASINVAARTAVVSRVSWEELFPSPLTRFSALRRYVSKFTHVVFGRARKISFQAHSGRILQRPASGYQNDLSQNQQGKRTGGSAPTAEPQTFYNLSSKMTTCHFLYSIYQN